MSEWADAIQAGYEQFAAAETRFREAIGEAAGLVPGELRLQVLKDDRCPPGAALAERLVEAMVSRAAHLYRPAGGELDLRLDAVLHALGLAPPERWADAKTLIVEAIGARRLDLPAVWKAIETIANSAEVQNAALMKTARDLVSAFYASFRSTKIRRVGGRPVLVMRVYTEKPYRGEGRTLSFSDRHRLDEVFHGLGQVAEWAGVANPVPDRSRFPGYHDRFQSRERFELSASLCVVTYFEKLEFHFDEGFARELSRFIGQYAAEELARQQAT